MDTRFSAAIHALILIAGADKPLTSEQIAASVGTNPSYIRRLTGLLKQAGILASRQGVGGFRLLAEPGELSLYRIYRAVEGVEGVHVFDLHQNPNDACIVGRHIRPVLTGVFREAEAQAEYALGHTTLSDCMEKMRTEIDREEKGGEQPFSTDITKTAET